MIDKDRARCCRNTKYVKHVDNIRHTVWICSIEVCVLIYAPWNKNSKNGLSLSAGDDEIAVNFPTVNPATTFTRQKSTLGRTEENLAKLRMKSISYGQLLRTQDVVEIGKARMTWGKPGKYSRPARTSSQKLVGAHDRHLTARPHTEAGPTRADGKPHKIHSSYLLAECPDLVFR